MADNDEVPNAPAPVEEAKEEVEEVAPAPDPVPPAKDDMPDWAKALVDKVDALADEVKNMTPVPPPVDEVVENDDAPVSLPWTAKPLFAGNHGHDH